MNSIDIFSVPWDVTTTYRHGCANGPDLIQSAYHQLDHSHPFIDQECVLNFRSIDQHIIDLNHQFSDKSHQIIKKLNQSISPTIDDQDNLLKINEASEQLNDLVYLHSLALLSHQSFLLCGGEHGVGIGYLKALSEKYSNFSILQFDSHMDCRKNYFGYKYSHASVVMHYSEINSINQITQVGIRDYDLEEVQYQEHADTNFTIFKDYWLHKQLFQGRLWHDICEEIIDSLTDHVMISLDVDGLTPYLCPGTGTPVPGGIGFNQLIYLFELLYKRKKIIGAELVEVNNLKNNDFDANVGARLLHLMAAMI